MYSKGNQLFSKSALIQKLFDSKERGHTVYTLSSVATSETVPTFVHLTSSVCHLCNRTPPPLHLFAESRPLGCSWLYPALCAQV